MSTSDFRLPSNVQPTHYDLTIKTDLKKEIFEGIVKIRQGVHPLCSTPMLTTED